MPYDAKWLCPAVMALSVIAQAGPAADGLPGGAGWVGTGLLGGVLSWILFINIPNRDKQLAGLIESRDSMVRTLTQDFRNSIQTITDAAAAQDKERRDDYRSSLAMVVQHCEKENAQISDMIHKDLDEWSTLIESLRQLIGELQKELYKAQTRAG